MILIQTQSAGWKWPLQHIITCHVQHWLGATLKLLQFLCASQFLWLRRQQGASTTQYNLYAGAGDSNNTHYVGASITTCPARPATAIEPSWRMARSPAGWLTQSLLNTDQCCLVRTTPSPCDVMATASRRSGSITSPACVTLKGGDKDIVVSRSFEFYFDGVVGQDWLFKQDRLGHVFWK